MEILETIFKKHSEVNLLNTSKGKHVVLLAGGMSSERYVSITSSVSVAKALIENGYMVTKVDPGADVGSVLLKLNPDLVFNCLHGTYGEDGCIPGLLNMMRIPYTHSGVLASSVSFNKLIMRQIFASQDALKFADAIIVSKSDQIKVDPIQRPYVIKPLTQGSSVGVQIIFPSDEFNFSDYEFNYGDKILVEKYIKGKEIQVAVLNGKALGVLEIKVLKNRFYDYQTKYTEGYAEHIMPANLTPEKTKQALQLSEYVYKELGCNGIARAEFLYNEAEEQFYFLEINTHPGMTSLSICPEIAEHSGISFNDMIEQIISSAKYEE
jgi:D-alanine-D-alanine ligase